MNEGITFSWWALLIRGLAAIFLGIAAFAWTGITLFALVVLFAAFVFVDGVFALVAGAMSRSGLLILEGVIGIVAGAILLRWFTLAAVVLVAIVAAWAVLTGMVELFITVRLRAILRNEWLLALAGIASILFGVLLVANPAAGLVTITWIIGAYALVSGALTVALAMRLRGFGRRSLTAAG